MAADIKAQHLVQHVYEAAGRRRYHVHAAAVINHITLSDHLSK